MAGSGLSDILESSFGSVANMMSGKRYPQNLRALKILVEELLRNVLTEVSTPDDLFSILEERARQARTTRLWLDMLIKPVLLMLQFVRAEKEADWPLHFLAVKLMMPYFFAAGHQNYARYGLYYLRTAEDLNPEQLEKFLKGEHVTRHTPGSWNGIWTDMMIETTFMKYGKGPDGIIGITLKPNTLKTWALSLHTCSVLSNDISDMTTKDKSTSQIHKEEMKGRISAGSKDHKNIRQKLQESSDPLDVSQLPTDKLLQVVSGRFADSSVNVDKGLAVGQEEMEKFELTCQLCMESTSSVNKKCIDIKATAEKHSAIIPTLLAIHALTGCDTVAQCWGIGKSTAVKLLKGNYHLHHVGDLSASTEEIIQESVSFLSACYGHTASSMHELRFKVWKSKVGRRNALSSVKIMSLPPTQEAFEQNALRAHLQTCIWKLALDEDPPTLDPLKHGWIKETLNQTLLPVLLPPGTPSASDYILKLLKCCCENYTSAKCGCAVARLPCTMFCECTICDDCYNQHTRAALRVLNESD
ncbi:uncharacterized protein LOC124285478 [Haliotis rubra]|uniref:uncharacterized protein LOC124285478 n=1 Tax=Haliotis rubra TaxID=36100 RepID=UPI001EE573A3|nr:uncharacterized protein LOC124285478 [Haliotis rubra]